MIIVVDNTYRCWFLCAGVQFIMEGWPFGVVWCKMVQYLIVVSAYASVYTLVLMSFDRFMAVVFPVSSRFLRTESNAVIACSISWCLILSTCLPTFFCHDLTKTIDDRSSCTFKESANCLLIVFQVGVLFVLNVFRTSARLSPVGSSGCRYRHDLMAAQYPNFSDSMGVGDDG